MAAPSIDPAPTATGERIVTVDLDDAAPFDVFRTWSRLEAAGVDVEGRVSMSGEGCHFRAWVDADEVGPNAVEELRLDAGDDTDRVAIDRTHVDKPNQVLFTRGPRTEAGPWHENPVDVVGELRARSDRLGLAGWSP